MPFDGTLRVLALCTFATAARGQAEPPVSPPAVESKADAVYPAAALAAGKEVTVIVRVTIAADGAVTNPEVVESGGPDFDAAALDAIRKWKFKPALREGVPVASRIRVPFLFAPPPPPATTTSSDAGPSEPVPDAGPAALVAPETAPATLPDAGPAAPLPQVTQVAPTELPDAGEVQLDGGEGVIEVTVQGRRRVVSRGTSDYQIETKQLAQVPHANAADFLKLAPGFLLTNEGGEGHAEQVFLRGFDAREGQDLEFSVDGVPVNESGNLHGNGYSDTHFVIPELIESLRVLEGPFDPRQGNYAVAGSAEYHLGLADRGLIAKASGGSYGTERALIAWGPPGATTGTFAAAQLYQTKGYGQNRDGRDASAFAQYETRSGPSLYRLTAQAYTASFHTAGVLREDDVALGRVGPCGAGQPCTFYDTYDTRQGEDAARYSLSGTVESRAENIAYSNQVFAIYRPLRLRENFTGYLIDVQEPQQQPHGQRGDLIDLQVGEFTAGARGSAKATGRFFEQPQEFELGYFARHDVASALQQRVETGTNAPYVTEANLLANLDDIGLYADANLRLLRWLSLRGGARLDLFTFNVQNLCAVKDIEHPSPSNPQSDVSCKSEEGQGVHREPNQSASTSSTAAMPRASLVFGPWSGVSLTTSAGRGVRSIDPVYITQDRATPFASIWSFEAGVSLEEKLAADVRLVASSTLFDTRVDQDLIFDQTAGRNKLAGATTRLGSANALRLSGTFFDVSANGTFVHASVDADKTLIAYVPDLVLRGDGSVFQDLPWALEGHLARVTLSTGITFVGRRPLPYGARSDRVFTIDANLEAGWQVLRAGLSITNLLDTQYRLGEYNYASDFHSVAEPTLVPVRHFAAGAPRALLFTLTSNFGSAR